MEFKLPEETGIKTMLGQETCRYEVDEHPHPVATCLQILKDSFPRHKMISPFVFIQLSNFHCFPRRTEGKPW